METSNPHALSVVRSLANLTFRERRPPSVWESHDVISLDLTSLKLAPGYFVPFLVPRKAISRNDGATARLLLDTAWTYSRTVKANFCVIAVDEKVDPGEADLSFASRYGVAIFDIEAQRSLADARDRDLTSRVLAGMLVRYIGRHPLSPYLPGRPVSGSRFFGRQQMLAQLTGTSKGNYTILGTRRIGKTSLLQQIKGSLELTYRDINPVFLNAQMCETSEELEQQLAVRLDSRNIKAVYSGKWISRYIIQRQVRAHDTVIFLDELDHAIRVDSRANFRFLSTLRILGEEEGCQIFLAGSYLAIRACRDMQTPLFNFTQPLFLGPLNESETVDMVSRPLTMLGIDLGGSDLPQAIFQQTRGYPELIQICCAEAVRVSCEDPSVLLTSRFLLSLISSRLFQERVVRVFLENTREIERLIFFVLLERAKTNRLLPDKYIFDLDEIEKLLHARDINIARDELEDAMLNLEVTSAIQRVPGNTDNYRFGLPSLVSRHSSDLPDYLVKAMSQALDDPTRATSSLVHSQATKNPAEEDLSLVDEAIAESNSRDFFISYTKADEDWASWIGWILEEAGYSVILQCWDFLPGTNFVSAMHESLRHTQRTIIVLSNEYLSSAYCRSEWTAAFASDPASVSRRLIPFRVSPCKPDGLMKTLLYLDLFGMSKDEARAAVLGAFEVRRKPDQEPDFPSDDSVAYPGTQALSSKNAATHNPAGDSVVTEGRIKGALERVELHRLLNDIPVEIFNMLVFALRPRSGAVSFMPTAQGERVVQLLEWSEGEDGCGLQVLTRVLNELTSEYL